MTCPAPQADRSRVSPLSTGGHGDLPSDLGVLPVYIWRAAYLEKDPITFLCKYDVLLCSTQLIMRH